VPHGKTAPALRQSANALWLHSASKTRVKRAYAGYGFFCRIISTNRANR
jgi:hypothetical protein